MSATSAEARPTPAYAAIAELLRARAGLSFGQSRRVDLEVGIGRAMARAGIAGLEAYAEALEEEEPRGGPLLDDLLVEVTVGETYFFREPEHFDFLRDEVFPGLLRQRDPGAPLRVWSAGCATGEEPYSLAILLEEQGLANRARILATDICRTAIARAFEGVYGRWSLRTSDEAFTGRYFAREGERFRLAPRFRERVTFEYLNLAFDSYPSFALGVWGMDIILCRNVLIYFDQPTIRTVARALYASLAEGGWLVTGPSDPLLTDHAPFETIVTSAGVFHRRGLSAQARSSQAAPALPAPKVFTQPAEHPGRGGQPPRPPRPRAPRPSPRVAPPADEPGACALRVRALANTSGAVEAVKAAALDTARFPLSTELHFLNAVLLISLNRDEEAARVLRQVLYLDRSLAVAHFVLGSLLARRGDMSGARAAYRNARDLAARTPPDEPLPLSDGERAARLGEAAAAEMARCDLRLEGTR